MPCASQTIQIRLLIYIMAIVLCFIEYTTCLGVDRDWCIPLCDFDLNSAHVLKIAAAVTSLS